METNSPDLGKKSVKNARAKGTSQRMFYFLCPKISNKTLVLRILTNAKYLIRFTIKDKEEKVSNTR